MDYLKTNASYVLEKLKKFSFEMPRGSVGEFKVILKEVELLEKNISTYKEMLKKTIDKNSRNKVN